MTSLWSFTMEDQCLDEDETLLSDEWETQSEELNFLCNNPGEEDIYRIKERGIKRKESSNVVVASESTAVSLVDQRRFMLQVTFEKLRRLEDPEACLRRTVLINNTLKMLHKQIYAEENPFVCSGVVTLHPPEATCAKDESPPSNPKMIRLSFDSSVTDDSRRKRLENTTSLAPGEGFCSSCISEGFTEDVDDDVFEPAEQISCDRESIFSELDNVFHSYICALET